MNSCDDWTRLPPGHRLVPCMQYRARIERQKAMRYGRSKERAAAIVKAEGLLRRCLEMDPCDGRAYVSLGRIYVMQQRYREARDLYKEGTRLTGAESHLAGDITCCW